MADEPPPPSPPGPGEPVGVIQAPTRKPLEEITLAYLVGHYESLTIPPFVPADDFARVEIRKGYIAGFGCMIAIAQRLQEETAERRLLLLKGYEQQVFDHALMLTDIDTQQS